jgi:hypothetical protein
VLHPFQTIKKPFKDIKNIWLRVGSGTVTDPDQKQLATTSVSDPH